MSPERSEHATAMESPVVAVDAGLPRLDGDWLQPIEFGMMAIPVGAREKRPLVVAAHGAASRPDWMCSAVRASVGPRPFVVCPHSVTPLTREASWSNPISLRSAIERAVNEVVMRFGPYVDLDDALYVGHSQGAMLAPAALALPGRAFRHALFFEGLPRDAPAARGQLIEARVERLLLVSGQSGWRQGHARFARSFDGTSIAARHVHADVGHFWNGEVHALVRRELDWLAGDPLRYAP